ncbi:hypothetical protein BDZ97DRAFT_648730 [Flammula alnicola]|nr:hypothetical protein BDZ97DRAFT_648730 [Flammula alnicola]
MLGPRSMDAGTPASGPRSSQPAQSQYPGHDHDRNDSAYGGVARTPAQRLIDRYERLSTPPLSPQTPPALMRNKSTYRRQYVYDYNVAASTLAMHDSDRDKEKKKHTLGGGLKKEGKSPIRQSLRNLLSVIKKGAGGLTKRNLSEDRLGVPGVPGGRSSGEDVGIGSSANGAGQKLNSQGGASGAANPSRPRKKMTGPLLYLTRGAQLLSPDVPGPLMWTTCSVTLDENKLIVSSFTGDMELAIHEIVLSRCSDIRSLSASQLSAEEATLLDGAPEGDKMKVFEVLFEGREREKFAAKSVRERAGWISAIWDAILPKQKGIALENEPPGSLAMSEEDDKATLPLASPIPTPLPQLSNLLQPSFSDRSLPPLPPVSPLPPVASLSIPENNNKKPQNLHLDLSELQGPISPSIYPPTSQAPSSVGSSTVGGRPRNLHLNTSSLISPSIYPPTSRPGSYFLGSPISSTTGSACPSSPSVANLSQLSVVRQRLAQIERNHSQLSAQSELTADSSTPTPSPVSSSGWSKRDAVFHNASARTLSQAKSPTASAAEDGEVSASRSRTSTRTEKHKDDVHDSVPLRHTSGHRSRQREEQLDKDLPPPRLPEPGPSKDDVRKISRAIADIQGVLGGESGYPTVHQMVVSLEHRAKGDKKALRDIQGTLTALGERVTDAVAAAARNAHSNSELLTKTEAGPSESQEGVMRVLEEIKERLAKDFPALANKLQEMKEAQDKMSTMDNIARTSSSPGYNSNDQAVADLQPVLDKLEEIRTLCNTPPKKEEKVEIKAEDKPSEHVDKILSLIQEDSHKQTLLAQQQADSVRYLNELNTWLEAFVNNGTSQIQGISMNIDRLCREMGFSAEETSGRLQDNSQPNLVNDIRQLVTGMKARDQNFAALQAAVHSLLEVLTASQNEKGADSQAIAGLIDRQRHDQQILFTTFTNEISGEIKGERLRFVEAMKEATAINVQMHVEQFKQELGREVMAMTEEVGRLHREKQLIENQISDLFSFYSKHKQSDMPLQTIQENVGIPTRQAPRANIPRSHHRLLPYPRQ